MIATSKNVVFPGHQYLLTISTDEPSLAAAWTIIKVSGYQYQWYGVFIPPTYLPCFIEINPFDKFKKTHTNKQTNKQKNTKRYKRLHIPVPLT